jgi:hypothetical protein
MESESIANKYEEVLEEYGQESPLLMQSVMQEDILRSEIRPKQFLKGLTLALPMVLFPGGIFIFTLWSLLKGKQAMLPRFLKSRKALSRG